MRAKEKYVQNWQKLIREKAKAVVEGERDEK